MLVKMWDATKQWLANSNVFKDTFTQEQITSMSVDDFVNKTLSDFAAGVNMAYKNMRETGNVGTEGIENWNRQKERLESDSNSDIRYSISPKYNQEYQRILDNAPRNEKGQLLAPNGKVSNLNEQQYAQVRSKSFKDWFGDWEKNANFANETNVFDNLKINYNGKEYDDFRGIQEESRRLGEKDISKYHSDAVELSEEDRRRLGRVYGRLLSRSGSTRDTEWNDLSHTNKKGVTYNYSINQVHPQLFHDIFEINRKYLHNGELVDLHDDYTNCKCYLSNDGLSGFAIEEDGNLVSVFNLSDKSGFLSAIKDYVIQEGATHLDAYASKKQNLREIYQKTLCVFVARILHHALFHYNPIMRQQSGQTLQGESRSLHFVVVGVDDEVVGRREVGAFQVAAQKHRARQVA